jgi:hypothetical protein
LKCAAQENIAPFPVIILAALFEDVAALDALTEEQKIICAEQARKSYELFMDYFYDKLAFCLGAQGFMPPAICGVLSQRASEYAEYKEWIGKQETANKSTLFSEAGKNIGDLFGGSAIHNVELIMTYGVAFSKRIQQAHLRELMLGDAPTQNEEHKSTELSKKGQAD